MLRLRFHCNNGDENAAQCYVIHTLPILLVVYPHCNNAITLNRAVSAVCVLRIAWEQNTRELSLRVTNLFKIRLIHSLYVIKKCEQLLCCYIVGKPEENRKLLDLSIDGSVILKWLLSIGFEDVD